MPSCQIDDSAAEARGARRIPQVHVAERRVAPNASRRQASASCSSSAPEPESGCGGGPGSGSGGAPQWGRRQQLAATGAALLLSAAPEQARAEPQRLAAPLWERLEARQLDKPVFNIPPREQEYPDFLEGEWDATVAFEGYSFPSKTIDKRRLVADTTIPGFIKLSIIYIPDVGSGATFKLRFRRRDGPDSPVTEDRAANIASIVEGYLKRPGELIRSVDYNPGRDPNRCTVSFQQGSNNNAERVELFTNALREADGVFFALESIRQVTLGYSTQFGVSRTQIGDYLHVWSFRRLEDGSVRARISTAAYVQPNDALKYTGGTVTAGGAPVPELRSLLSVSTEPVVLYSHTVLMRRAT